MKKDSENKLLVGIDIGSTTVKAAVVDAYTHGMVFSTYRRHHAHQAETAMLVLDEVEQALVQQLGPESPTVLLAVTGSGGKDLATALGVPYVQEVVANSIAVATHYPKARVAIELGGQDAKMVFFEPGQEEGTLKVADMRMNGSCAGGTGAFLDEIASLLKTPVEDLDSLAARGTTLYSISGRCGVFAKTDIQPLINQGAAKEDIVLSTFHAVAKQTLGGLAQGLDVIPPRHLRAARSRLTPRSSRYSSNVWASAAKTPSYPKVPRPSLRAVRHFRLRSCLVATAQTISRQSLLPLTKQDNACKMRLPPCSSTRAAARRSSPPTKSLPHSRRATSWPPTPQVPLPTKLAKAYPCIWASTRAPPPQSSR